MVPADDGSVIFIRDNGRTRRVSREEWDRRFPDRFRTMNPPNGWGDYDGLVEFVEGYLLACRAHPSATVRISR